MRFPSDAPAGTRRTPRLLRKLLGEAAKRPLKSAVPAPKPGFQFLEKRVFGLLFGLLALFSGDELLAREDSGRAIIAR